jgi:hypothetical protein
MHAHRRKTRELRINLSLVWFRLIFVVAALHFIVGVDDFFSDRNRGSPSTFVTPSRDADQVSSRLTNGI